MRKPIIAGNWKMHKTVSEAVSLVESLKGTLADVDNVEVVFCPPFTALASVADAIKGTNFKLGAQNMYHKLQGAFTGEVSPLMLKDLNCDYVILGHSERREYFGETDEAINLKAKAAFENGLTPIVCVGEKLEEREAGITEKLVASQTEKALAGLTDEQIVKVVVAYEPVWAIGTGKTATSEDANNVCKLIRTTIAKMYSQELAEKVRIQYGGSVKPDNATELMAQSDIDGALVGGASLDAPSFTAIVKY